MSLKHDQCDRQRIKDFVGSRMTPSQQATFEEHLGHCEECRDTLWEQTADPDSWEKAGTYLRDDDAELEPLSSLSGTSGDCAGRNFDVDRLLKSLAPTDDPQMLGRLDGYEISGVIGCGGMGAVLKGFDRPLSRVVAIKVMAPHLATSGAARKRFAREAQAAAAMTHENVIDIYGVAESNGLPYLVMPYARGQSLQKRIDERGPLPVVEVLRIGSQIAAGLAAAHQQGLVHRDIKPANILLSDGIERLVITDFGLARAVDDASVTRTGVIAGTPQYMSPEQARGDAIDHRSDLFSLGSVLYTACTGRVPFRAESAYGILRRITDNEPRSIREINPQFPDWLCRVIEKLHSKSSDDRYATAEEVCDLLQRCLVHEHSPNTPLPAELQTASNWRRPGRKLAAVLGIVAAAVLVAIAIQVGTADPDSPAPGVAGRQSGQPSPADAEVVTSATDGTANQEESSGGDFSSGNANKIPTIAATLKATTPGSNTQNVEVGLPKISTNETAWNDPLETSPFDIQRTAQRLAEETQSSFANAPAAKGPLEEGIEQ
jgi:serine/threonine protein kinase